MDPISVLLVDDNQTFQRIATDFMIGYDELVVVGVAPSGEEALAQAKNLRPDVVLIDLNLPGLSGLETILCLRTLWPGMAIIALSLLDTGSYQQAAQLAGADEFIIKASLYADLLPAIRRVVQN